MSDEFWLRTKDTSALMTVAEVALVRIGMRVQSTITRVSASWPDAHPSVEKWGGNVQLVLNGERVLLTLNGVPSDFVTSLVAETGLEVTVEET